MRRSMDRNSKQYILDRVQVNAVTGCWIWQLSTNPQTGYGQLGRRPYTAHRLSYLLWRGRAEKEVLRHRCHNKVCCNADHLIEGTHGDNYADSLEVHDHANKSRRGRPARNAIPVILDGILYPSKVAAMKALAIAPRTLEKRINQPS